jgi:hypothetical protein
MEEIVKVLETFLLDLAKDPDTEMICLPIVHITENILLNIFSNDDANKLLTICVNGVQCLRPLFNYLHAVHDFPRDTRINIHARLIAIHSMLATLPDDFKWHRVTPRDTVTTLPDDFKWHRVTSRDTIRRSKRIPKKRDFYAPYIQ